MLGPDHPARGPGLDRTPLSLHPALALGRHQEPLQPVSGRPEAGAMREATEGRVPGDAVAPRVQARTPDAGTWAGAVVAPAARPFARLKRGHRPRDDADTLPPRAPDPTPLAQSPRPRDRPATWGARATPPQRTLPGRRGRGVQRRSAPSTRGGRRDDVSRVTWVVGKVSRHTGVATWQDPGWKVPEGREPPGVRMGSRGRELPWDRPVESGAAGWRSPRPGTWPSARVASPQDGPELQGTRREPDATRAPATRPPRPARTLPSCVAQQVPSRL